MNRRVKVVQNIENHDWKAEPLRYDPSRGYMLCRTCWNGRHWSPIYKDKRGVRVNLCDKNGCGCGCGCTDTGPRKIKFTGAGQRILPEADPIYIGPRADQLAAQVQALKK
jgi:hypothetical protein